MFDFKIVKHIAKIGERKSWSLELNLVSINGEEAKLDVRAWSPTHERMGKGVTLSEDEAKALADAIMKEI